MTLASCALCLPSRMRIERVEDEIDYGDNDNNLIARSAASVHVRKCRMLLLKKWHQPVISLAVMLF